MQFEFIHTADLHLDSPMRGLSRYEGVPEDTMRAATRDAFERLIDEAIRRQVAFIVISGDIADGGWNDVNTGLFFIKQCGRAAAKDIQVFVIWGNHDADSEGARKLTMPPGVHVFSSRKAEQVQIPELQVAVTGQSYGKRDVTENLAAGYPPGKAGWFNVALLHTALGGYPEHASYAPCDLGTLKALAIDYWALGHVHTREIVNRDPWIVFPGNLQGRSIRETGPRGALVVQVEDGRVLTVESLEVDVARWALANVDVSAARTLPEVADLTRAALAALLTDLDARPLAVRINLTGLSPAHGQLSLDPNGLRDQLRGVAAGLHGGNIWIEQIKLRTSPLASAKNLVDRGDALAELQRLLEASLHDPDLHKALREEFFNLNKVAAEALDIDAAKPLKEQRWHDLIQQMSSGLINALLAGE
ncbi:metallophosphoesterase family protein [Nevskia ramosa]|uniref:metallophosphoesterase family protein n=1 Tax=Nevskia ramosa TaxID=64002 RepID=UPI003D11DC7E